MSSEVCPKCGRSFKRLKSHLPHCKALKSSKTTSPQLEETTVSPSSPLPPVGPNSPHSAKREGFTQKNSMNTKINEQVAKLSLTPTSTKTSKQKLSEKIKMALEMSVPTSSLPSKTSKVKKKVPTSSQIEQKMIKNNLENVNFFPKTKTKTNELTKSFSSQNDKKVMSTIDTNLEQLSLNLTARKKAKSTSESNILKNSKHKGTSKKKDIFIEKTGPNKVKDITVKASAKDSCWLDEGDEKINLQEFNMSTPWQEQKITIHNVRTTLGRSKQNGQQKTNSFVNKLSTDEFKCENINSHDNQSGSLSLQQEAPGQIMTLPRGKNEIVPLRDNSCMSDLLKLDKKECSFTQRADILKDGLRMDGHTMGLVALSSPRRTFLEAEVSISALKKDLMPLIKPNEQKAERDMVESRINLRTEDGRTMRGALSQQRLGQVTLRDLPDWLVSHSPRRPRDAVEMVQRGWQWYYRKYIDVKRGGVGGITMLLTGYCILSYVWVYPHLKHVRWRKYH